MSGFLINFNEPHHWASKHQKINTRSLNEAEIYATNQCFMELIHLRILPLKLNLLEVFIPKSEPVTLYNENIACVYWSN